MTNLFSPGIWTQGDVARAGDGGVWVRTLRAEADGDGIALCHLEPGATHQSDSARPTNLMVLDGTVSVDGAPASRIVHAGTYTPVGVATIGVARDDPPALFLLLSGPSLGDDTRSIGSPRGWIQPVPEMQALPVCGPITEGDLAERLVGFAHLEAGGSVPAHPHLTAHIFVYLDGDVDDEIIFPDGRSEQTRRGRGDFVVYPFPSEHRLASPTGCSIFFVHEPVSYLGGS